MQTIYRIETDNSWGICLFLELIDLNLGFLYVFMYEQLLLIEYPQKILLQVIKKTRKKILLEKKLNLIIALNKHAKLRRGICICKIKLVLHFLHVFRMNQLKLFSTRFRLKFQFLGINEITYVSSYKSNDKKIRHKQSHGGIKENK